MTKAMLTDERLTYTVREAVKLLGHSKNSLYEACGRGEVPHLKIGKRILIPHAELGRILNEAGKAKDWGVHDG